MQQLLDKWERLRRSEYLRPDEKLMLNHCISDLKRFINHSGEANEMVRNRSAVEWLIDMHFGGIEHVTPYFKKHIEEAKEMEKEQMIDFAWECQEMFKHEIKEYFEEKFNDGGNK
jgi:hypothetical protein